VTFRPRGLDRARRSLFPPECRADRGSSSLEITVLFPVVLLLVFAVVQGALYYHARNVALAAASDGLTAARARAGSSEEGRRAAASFLERAGGRDVLLDAQVAAVRSGATAEVTVSGHVMSLLPGLPGLSVSQTASGPVERFTRVGEQ
jgi:Flp pilus assembly protein TadG